MKDCRGCGKRKPTEDFYRHAGRPYGPCRSCRCAKAKDRYQAMTEELERLRATQPRAAARPVEAGPMHHIPPTPPDGAALRGEMKQESNGAPERESVLS